MANVQARAGRHERLHDFILNESHKGHAELEALREENKQLRELVIQLSKIVVQNVVDRK